MPSSYSCVALLRVAAQHFFELGLMLGFRAIGRVKVRVGIGIRGSVTSSM